MLHKIYINSEASLKNVHAVQIFPVHTGDCNLPTHQLRFPTHDFDREGLG